MGGDSLEGGTAVTGAEEEWLGLTCFLWRARQFWNHTWERRKAMEVHHMSTSEYIINLVYKEMYPQFLYQITTV